MALTRNFVAQTGKQNTIALNWELPIGFNSTDDELIVARTITHYPMELFNTDFPNRATDSRPIEILRGKTIAGIGGINNNLVVDFDGVDDFAEVVTPSAAISSGITNKLSVFLWIKSTGSGLTSAFFNHWDNGGEQKWYIGQVSGGDLEIILSGNGTSLTKRYVIPAGQGAMDGTWRHVGFTYDGTQASATQLKVYLDGADITGLVTKTGDGNLTTLHQPATEFFVLGKSVNGEVACRINEPNMFNTPLSGAEVSELYNSGEILDISTHSKVANLVGWWRMGEGDTFPILSDQTANGNDFTMVNMDAGDIVADGGVPSISVSGNVLTDTAAAFPTTPSLAGRLFRDANSKVHRVVSNTATTITLDGAPADGKYVVMIDFPRTTRAQENYEFDIRTTSGSGFIKDLVILEQGTLNVKTFETDELAGMLFQDANGDKFIVKNNTTNTIFFYETDTPQLGLGMAVLNKFFDSQPLPYVDNFLTTQQATSRSGTGLLDNRFYYYTIFTKEEGTNVARAEFATTDSGVSTQSAAISTDDTKLTTTLFNLWPSVFRDLDATGDLEDLMNVFGFQLNEIYALIDTYNLQDPDNVLVTALLPLSEQTGLPSVGFSIGADTLRRIARDMISCWRLKGSKEGIAIFIRKITTWDVTNGTADFSAAIQDFLPNVNALRFFDPNLGSLNTRLTETDPFVAGGRFARSLPGIVIPGFFTFREFVIDIPNVALFTSNSEGFTTGVGTTTMTDTTQNYGAVDSLVGNFLIPNAEEINDIFEIIGNTATTITVRGTVNNRNPGGDYAVLSPLNSNRFQILNNLLPVYIPFGTRAGFRFITI